MTADLWTAILIAVLTAFVGYEVISRVPVLLHTPLMSRVELHPRDRSRGSDRRTGSLRDHAARAGDRPRGRHHGSDERHGRLHGHGPHPDDV